MLSIFNCEGSFQLSTDNIFTPLKSKPNSRIIWLHRWH